MKRLTIMLLLLLTLCGCMDKHELEDSTFLIILGLDKAPSGVEVSVCFPLTQSVKRAGEYETVSASAETAIEALKLIEDALPGELALHSIKTVVISKEFEENGARECLYTLWRQTELRSTAAVLKAPGSAEEFVRARIENALTDPLRQEELLLERDKPTQVVDYVGRVTARTEILEPNRETSH